MKMLAHRLVLATLLSTAIFAAHADNTPQPLPYAQSWTNTALIAANDNWGGIPGVVGYRGDNITGGTGVDPQTLLGEGTAVVDVIANQTSPNTVSTGGVAEFELADPVVALNGSGTADAPYVLINLDTTGQHGINVAYKLRDLDGSADNAVQPVALQYRVGNSGNFTNVPAGFVADATTPNAADLVTPVSALLPAAADDQPLVQVRIITSNAVGNDEWVGIDDIAIGVSAGPPELTINDASVSEGDSGATPLFFTFKLSKPAGAGGVSIDYATADGSATAGSDYVAAAGTVAIPEGQTSVTISIDALGDAVPEGDENFVVDIVDASGALVGDAQGIGSIRNDDYPQVAIHDIQGDGLLSAYNGQVVATEGVVTARKFFSNAQQHGFFLQSLTPDTDAATSEAVFVFVAGAAPAHAVVGNRVRVIAKVKEYTPSSDPHQLSITELIEPTIELLESGVALPAPVELTAADLRADAEPGTLERLESMRVSVARSIVVGAADGRIIEKDATATTDGVFYVTLPGVAVPFREPGLSLLDVTPLPAGKSPPRFDTNPERLKVRSWGQIGSQPLAVDVQAEVSGLRGVLDYADRNWTLLQDAGAISTATGGKLPQAVNDAAYEAVTIGGFNLLRFFDEVNDGNGAPALTAAALDKRLGKTALAICDYLKAPDILGVVEVENLRVLNLLAERINATCARAPGYIAQLVPAPASNNNINVGYLVSTRDNGAGQARVEVVSVEQHGANEKLDNPDQSSSVLNDRPPLALRAVVHQDNGASYPVTVIVNHLRSFLDHDSLSPGTNGWLTDGARVRAKRGQQALYLAGLVESLQQQNPDEKIVLLGDFNAFAFNDGYTDVMGVIKGEEAAADQVLDYIDSPLGTPLVDGAELIQDPAQRYSYVFDGNAQTLDHVLVNQALLGDALGVNVDHARINAEFGVDNFGDAGTPIRVSDHDPVRLTIAVPAFRSANLSITANAAPSSVRVGETAHFEVNVANAGPNAGEFAAVAFVFEALVAPGITAANGWACAAPVQDAATTTVTCSTASFATGSTAAFALDVIAPDALGGGTLRMAAAIQSQTTDPANADNQAAASVAVLADADLSVNLGGPTKKLHYGYTETFQLMLRNAGPDAAWQPVVTLRGDAPAANVAIVAPAGWECAVADDGGDFEASCVNAGAFAAGASQRLDVAITIPARSDSTQFLSLRATANATTPDPDHADNTATYSNRIVGVP